MVPEMILDERRDEVVTVVIAFVTPQFEIDASIRTRSFEKVRVQLLLEELIGQALIDEYLRSRQVF